MDNQYQKTFPDLMEGKKILYVHGFGSAGSTHTAQLLREMMPQSTVISPDLPIHPEEALQLLHTLTAEEKPDLIIGTSMGGMYTEILHHFDRICVNPAFQMAETMHEHGMVGKQTFQNPRQDGIQEFIVTKALVKEYKAATEQCFSEVTDDEQQRVYGLFGDNDQTVDTYDLFRSHYPNAIRFHGEHRLNDSVLLHSLIPVIRWIDDRQAGRERHKVFIDFNIICDENRKPVSSLRKAIEFLIEKYEVYIVADAPTASPDDMRNVTAWAYEYINVPAWNRIIFTNQPHLLVGDYFLRNDREERTEADGERRQMRGAPFDADRFLGTVLHFGKDDLKTFEDVITYFDRLGGQ